MKKGHILIELLFSITILALFIVFMAKALTLKNYLEVNSQNRILATWILKEFIDNVKINGYDKVESFTGEYSISELGHGYPKGAILNCDYEYLKDDDLKKLKLKINWKEKNKDYEIDLIFYFYKYGIYN